MTSAPEGEEEEGGMSSMGEEMNKDGSCYNISRSSSSSRSSCSRFVYLLLYLESCIAAANRAPSL